MMPETCVKSVNRGDVRPRFEHCGNKATVLDGIDWHCKRHSTAAYHQRAERAQARFNAPSIMQAERDRHRKQELAQLQDTIRLLEAALRKAEGERLLEAARFQTGGAARFLVRLLAFLKENDQHYIEAKDIATVYERVIERIQEESDV